MSRCSSCDNLTFNTVDDDGVPRFEKHVMFFDLRRSAAKGCPSCSIIHELYVKFQNSVENHKIEMWTSTISTCLGVYGEANSCYLEYHVLEGEKSPWRAIGVSGIPMESPSPIKCAEYIKTRHHECTTTHAKCKAISARLDSQGDQYTPTRLINVGSQDTPPFLYQHNKDSSNKDKRPSYTALSHCWGSTQIIRTTKGVYQNHKAEVPWSSLSKTFQDAILITRSLDVQYIWIDSLCIIQDDEDDWALEAPQMAHIYQNAFVTLAATAAPGGDTGMFTQKSKTEHTVISHCGTSHTIYARRMIRHSAFHETETKYHKLPLLERGWTFQEQLLSLRTVHFTDTELLWDCFEGLFCECGLGSGWFLLKADLGNAMHEPNMDSHDVWASLVGLYVKRKLTYDKDRLPAISSLASQFEHVPGRGKYLAGLWENDLPFALLWQVLKGPSRRPYHSVATKSQQPSWSWTSVECQTIGFLTRNDGLDYESQVEVLDASCSYITSDPRGMVSGGYITLRGKLYPLYLHDRSDSDWVYLRNSNYPADSYCSVKPDVPLDSPSVHIADGEKLFFLPVKQRLGGKWHDGLLLQRIEEPRDDILPSKFSADFLYRRLGMGALYPQTSMEVILDISVTMI